jgi:hypothetical protein
VQLRADDNLATEHEVDTVAISPEVVGLLAELMDVTKLPRLGKLLGVEFRMSSLLNPNAIAVSSASKLLIVVSIKDGGEDNGH